MGFAPEQHYIDKGIQRILSFKMCFRWSFAVTKQAVTTKINHLKIYFFSQILILAVRLTFEQLSHHSFKKTFLAIKTIVITAV